MPVFRDEHIIIIAPGSHTTLAQLGLPESFTPARLRFKSRMFSALKPGEWEPNKIRKKPKRETAADSTNPARPGGVGEADDAEESEYEEDPVSDEGAVWPIQRGAITNLPCFYALMHHVHNSLNAPFHTPILVVGQPCWTAKDHENITQFFFEKFKTPGFAIIDSAQAACYAFGLSAATVVDVGADKTDVTTVVDHLIDEVGRTRSLPDCGGEAMTSKLQSLLASKGFNRNMCEQLKKSPICEILPADMPIPGTADANKPATSAGVSNGHSTQQRNSQGALGSLLRGPGQDTEVGGDAEDDEGVIDVASIVARGNTTEFLAKKEAEKAEKLAAKKKGGDAAAAASKPVKQRNFEREKNSFFYEDHAVLDAIKGSDMSSAQMTEAAATLDEGPKKASGTELSLEGHNTSAVGPSGTSSSTTSGGPTNQSAPRRELTVGPERFQAASGNLLIDLSSAIHRTVLANPHTSRRADLWDSLIIIGNGARVRGFKEALLQILHSRFLISPSSATIFTSELPSNFSTPHATGGTNTPQPGQVPLPQGGSGVNPLLYAATTASASQQQPGHPPHTPQQQGHNGYSIQPGQQQHLQSLQPQTHSGHGQTPTSIRTARLPEYFPEWKDAGSEEAAFLGAQVAAKVVFVNDIAAGTSKGFMSRSDYNESGPSGIHEFSLS